MLALAGSGEYLPDMEVVDRFLLEGLGDNPTVICLPTAAGTEGPERIAYWSDLGTNYFKSLGVNARALPVITRKDAQDPALAAQLGEADFIYLSGGRPDYLLAVLKDSLVWQAVQDVLARGGVLAGCSAGAMILGEKIPGLPRWRRAFNLLTGAVVLPHFDEIPAWMVRILHHWIGRRGRMVGVPGYTALIVNGKTCKVAGKSNVTLWDHHGKRTFPPGESLIW